LYKQVYVQVVAEESLLLGVVIITKWCMSYNTFTTHPFW